MDVSLYMSHELFLLLEYKSVDFNTAFITTIQNVISSHIFSGAKQLSISTASAFQVRPLVEPTNVWFVGVICIKKIFDDYFAAYATGRFAVPHHAKDFLLMERKSKELYTREHPNINQIIDQVVYGTPSGQLKCWSLTCDKSDKPI